MSEHFEGRELAKFTSPDKIVDGEILEPAPKGEVAEVMNKSTYDIMELAAQIYANNRKTISYWDLTQWMKQNPRKVYGEHYVLMLALADKEHIGEAWRDEFPKAKYYASMKVEDMKHYPGNLLQIIYDGLQSSTIDQEDDAGSQLIENRTPNTN